MDNIFLADEQIESAPPVVGFQILSLLVDRDDNQISIFDVVDRLKREPWFSSRKLLLGMVFLYSLGIIEFDQSYIVKNV